MLSGCQSFPLLLLLKASEASEAFFAQRPQKLRAANHLSVLGTHLPSRPSRMTPQFPVSPNKYTGPFHWRVLLLITLGKQMQVWVRTTGNNTGECEVAGSWVPEGFLSLLRQDLKPLLRLGSIAH